MSYIFGPVPSRRLGRSLGVDVVPLKTCTYDCVYCQLGRTTCKTAERREWVPLEAVLAELKTRLSSGPDYITFSGSGEPTLFSRLGELIERIKALTDIPVAVLTNGSLLWQAEVRSQLMNADLVIPSLDASDQATFRMVNRPHADISFDVMLGGLVDFRREYPGRYWLEVFLLADHASDEAELTRLIRCVGLICPDRVQLNTVSRPPAESNAAAVPRERLAELAARFTPPAEVIVASQGAAEQAEFSAGRAEVLNMLRRRPCSIDDIADGLGLHRNEVIKCVEELTAQKLVVQSSVGGRLYYKAQG